jgi:hypothetical protein
MNIALDWPSPCSPENTPPWLTTSELTSSMKARYRSRPPGLRRPKLMRQCTSPCPKCP